MTNAPKDATREARDRPDDLEPMLSISETALVRAIKQAVIDWFADLECSVQAELEAPLLAAAALRLVFEAVGQTERASNLSTIPGIYSHLRRHL